jgi:hypothetical protein
MDLDGSGDGIGWDFWKGTTQLCLLVKSYPIYIIVDMAIIDPRMMGPGPVEFGAH